MNGVQVLPTTTTDSTTATSTSTSPSSEASLGIKAQTKRQHHLAAKERKNGVHISSSSSSSSSATSSTSSSMEAVPSVALRKMSSTRGGRTSCCRMLFDAPDHDDVLAWLEEGLAQQRQRLTDKYGFDVTQAEEGVYDVPLVL